ncbi:hypothetical protein DB347_17955 [Opitutaceae bacterium EW11]|nr:hypothetical protein DB347_17955 [Opitutaceae bacterium EW11]
MLPAGSRQDHFVDFAAQNMTKKSDNLLDLEAICERVIWSLNLSAEQLMTYARENRAEALHTINNPKNGGIIILGQQAIDRFWSIATRHLKNHPDRRARTDLAAFVKLLRETFSDHFLDQGREADQRNVDRWISAAYAKLAKSHTAVTHFIPCGLFLSSGIKRFQVGPVTFFHRSEFFQIHGDAIEQQRESIRAKHRKQVEEAVAKGFPAANAATPEQSIQLANRLTDGLLESFERYNWFAEISIADCHPDVSYNRALFTVRGALNILKVLLGSYYTNRLCTANDSSGVRKAATLIRDEKGELNISVSSTPVDNVIGDQWLDRLTADRYFPILSDVLLHSSKFDPGPPLCARLMDALFWFGEAVSERYPAAKIVKFVTAIECLCGTGIEKSLDGTERGVTEIVTSRAAILYSVFSNEPMEAAKKEVARIYTCRSNLVHGSVSPHDEKVAAELARTDTVTNLIILAAVEYYRGLGLKDTSFNEKGLRAAFNRLEAWNKEGRPPTPSSV